MHFIASVWRDFYARNIFERLVVYIFLSRFLSVLYVEGALRELLYYHPQIYQWIFFSFLTIDHFISLPKIIRIRFSPHPTTAFVGVLLLMVAHGLTVGIIKHNPTFTIFNDTVPLLMIALNVLRMQSSEEKSRPISFNFILNTAIITAFATNAFSLILVTIGYIAETSYKVDTVLMAVFFAALFTDYKLSKSQIFAVLFVFALGAPDFNRTNMLFVALILCAYIGKQILKNPSRGVVALAGAAGLCALIWGTLPEDSMAYKRIEGLQNLDLSKRTGAVGERQQEWDSINKELRSRGVTDEMVGFGFGGTYTMRATHTVIEDYGHAHYSWAWFKLRFGNIGFIYLALLAGILIYNCTVGGLSETPVGVSVGFLCLFGLLYLMTYVNAIYLSSGLHFLKIPDKRKRHDKQTFNSA